MDPMITLIFAHFAILLVPGLVMLASLLQSEPRPSARILELPDRSQEEQSRAA